MRNSPYLKYMINSYLLQMHALPPAMTAVLHEVDVQDYLRCTETMVHAPENNAEPPVEVSCYQEEVGCGHLNEICKLSVT
ncbi:hypothetical protein J6590_081678 [Homalodisca vitripennis]|nr:hypothetical protein J6590_081678 [Homalodisca vitripennis]